jgi:hypothetical protein
MGRAPAFSAAFGLLSAAVLLGCRDSSPTAPDAGAPAKPAPAGVPLPLISRIPAKFLPPGFPRPVFSPISPQRLSLSTAATTSVSVDGPFALGGDFASSAAQDINAAGVVAGYGVATTFEAVRWAVDGTPTLLDNPTDYIFSIGNGINEGGAVVGESCTNFFCRAVRWTAEGFPTVLPSSEIGSENSVALSINSSGQVIGQEHDGQLFHAVHWSAGGIATRLPRPEGLGTGPDDFSVGWDINDAGVMTGFGCGVRCKAIRWAADGSPTLLEETCELCGSEAFSINESGQIAGEVTVEGGIVQAAAIWSASGELTVLPIPEGHDLAIGTGINDAGQVAGYARVSGTNASHAVIWLDGAPFVLPDGGAGPSFAQTIGLGRAAGSINSQATVWTFLTYSFSGFLQPVEDPTVAANTARAGSAIPVRFRLGGDRGLDIFLPGYPRFEYGVCESGTEDAIEQTVAVTASGLSYSPANDTYTYIWKTPKSLANQCGKFQLGLKDGSTHYALFRFGR